MVWLLRKDRSQYVDIVKILTLTSKGPLTIPRQLRNALGLAPVARLQASIDRHGRMVLVTSKYEPEDVFRHRPKVNQLRQTYDKQLGFNAQDPVPTSIFRYKTTRSSLSASIFFIAGLHAGFPLAAAAGQ